MDSYLDQLRETLASATAGLSGEMLTRHPEGKWSIAEILEHLYLTYTGTIKGFQRCMEAGTPLATSPTLAHHAKALLVLGVGKFPPGREAPKYTRPRGIPFEKIVAEVEMQIRAMDEAITRCEERYGKEVKLLDHPILGPFTGQQWRKFHWVHGRHHVKQIERLREKAETCSGCE